MKKYKNTKKNIIPKNKSKFNLGRRTTYGNVLKGNSTTTASSTTFTLFD